MTQQSAELSVRKGAPNCIAVVRGIRHKLRTPLEPVETWLPELLLPGSESEVGCASEACKLGVDRAARPVKLAVRLRIRLTDDKSIFQKQDVLEVWCKALKSRGGGGLPQHQWQ